MTIRIEHGDMRTVLGKMVAEGETVQSIVTDPPYHLQSIVKRFANSPRTEASMPSAGPYERQSRGFMGKMWDGGDIAFQSGTWSLCWELLPPGGHLVAFAGTRTYHRMAVAIEEAGFEIRDTIGWLYGSGFPKSHNVSKGIDKAADYKLQASVRRASIAAVETAGLTLPGNSRHDWTIGEHAPGDKWWAEFQRWLPSLTDEQRERVEGEIVAVIQKTAGWFTRGDIYAVTAPATDEACQWEGWGTALKPAMELICLARKPLSGTVAGNVLKHGTGALNIDGCRVGNGEVRRSMTGGMGNKANPIYGQFANSEVVETETETGRWPANVVHDGSDEVVSAFPDSNNSSIGKPRSAESGNGWGMTATGAEYADAGTAARFFYSAKADSGDRLGSKHPTVKPVDLMRWLVRLITPPGGTVLDPFAGSGTTGMACMAEGFDAILIEREAEYVADIRARIAHVHGDDTPLFMTGESS